MPRGGSKSGDESDDDLAYPRTISDDDVRQRTDRTGPHRATPSEVTELIAASAQAQAMALARAQATAQRQESVRRMELHSAEWFGVDGRGGRLESMATQLREHDDAIASHGKLLGELLEFKGRLIWMGGLALTIGGAGVAVVVKVIDHIWK